MTPRDEAVLLDIAFFADTKTQAAVIHEILVIGEASKRLSAEFRIV